MIEWLSELPQWQLALIIIGMATLWFMLLILVETLILWLMSKYRKER